VRADALSHSTLDTPRKVLATMRKLVPAYTECLQKIDL
jgi:hypothetical protein